jgi:chaperonin GroEL
MPYKQILFRSAARKKILRGATQLADAIRVTLDPRSKSVLIEKKWGAPLARNDGVTAGRRRGHSIGVAVTDPPLVPA